MTSISAVIIFLIVLLFSAILHEIAHGVVADWFGDDTARMMGRITLNPIVHIDPYFSILIPLLLFLGHSPVIFGAAKPVPVNYYRLRDFRWGVFWVSIAGILTNLFVAFAFSIPLHFSNLSPLLHDLFFLVVEVNVFLAIVNSIPIPPVDGSKVLAALIGPRAINWIMSIEMRGLMGILPFIILIYFLFSSTGFTSIMLPIAQFFFRLFGIPFQLQ
jgi:Zn-dependent protease